MDLALQLHLSGLQTGDQLADVFGAFSDDEALNAGEECSVYIGTLRNILQLYVYYKVNKKCTNNHYE